jgi:hypothetical protein
VENHPGIEKKGGKKKYKYKSTQSIKRVGGFFTSSLSRLINSGMTVNYL